MKKHSCPFLDSLENCCNKNQNMGSHRKLNKCPYNNPKKCKWYNEWLKEKKLFREVTRGLKDVSELEAKE